MKSLYQRLQEVDENSQNYKENLKGIFEQYRKNSVINGAINGEYALTDILNGNFEMFKEESKLVRDSEGNMHKRNIERKLTKKEKREMKKEVKSVVTPFSHKIKNYLSPFLIGIIPGLITFAVRYNAYENRVDDCFDCSNTYVKPCLEKLFNDSWLTGGIVLGLGILGAVSYLQNEKRKLINTDIKFIDDKIKEAYSPE